MLRLRAFGGLTLRLDGTPITGVVTQRRQMALLALLAVSGDEGMSRDKLLAYLWPEKGTDASRHILNQLLYSQRQHAGDAGLFLGRKTLRLNPSLIESDVHAFETAIAAGEAAQAVAHYRGPFLDGFFLTDAAEFEAWVEQQRQRFARRCAEALEGLGRAASAAGDFPAAVRWLQRLQEMDPLDAGAAVGLAEALIGSGDRPAALRTLREHQELVRKRLDVEPDRKVSLLEERLAASTSRSP
jgi:DNA-binding SARP family transcriptional activator